MSTGSEAADKRIACIAAAAPEFTDEQFGLIKGLVSRVAPALASAAPDDPADQIALPGRSARRTTPRRAA